MVKTGVQKCGTNWRVILRGEAQEIEVKHWSMFNHGATKSELDWETETCAHFWSTPEKILKAFTNAHLFRMLNVADELRENDRDSWEYCCKGIDGGFMPQARVNAQAEFDDMESMPSFKPFQSVSIINLDCFAMGTIRAEKPDPSS
jgi:hypothetical protein